MNDWPDSDADLQRIIDYYKHALREQPGKLLLDYLREKSLNLRELALKAGINAGVVSFLVSGKRELTNRYVAEIKKVADIPDSDVPIPSDRTIYSGAAAETMMMIRDRWFAEPNEQLENIITPHQVLALEFIVRQRERDVRRGAATNWFDVFQDICRRLPQIRFRNLEDFSRFRTNRSLNYAHCVFKDALHEGNLSDEFEQATTL